MSSQGFPCRRPEIAWRVIEDEAVVVNPKSGLVYPLNPVATLLWTLSDGTCPKEKIVDAIADKFDAPREQIEADMERFLGELCENGLIEYKSSG